MTDRDLLQQIGKLRFRVQELETERNAARDMALEEAAQCVDRATSGRAFFAGYSFEDFETVSSEIRALKSKSE